MTRTPPAPEILYAVRQLERSFRLGSRRIPVLRGVDLDVACGDFLAIKGSSGAGKSTLLHIMGLLDRPTRGSLSFSGEDLVDCSDRRLTSLRATEFSFVFQFYYLLPEFSALENVQMPALIAGAAAHAHEQAGSARLRRARAASLLERVGLGHRSTHRPSQLSGGERQRVAIARALMNQPRLVLCDEPTGNLDSVTAQGIHELLLELNQSLGQTIVVVTHEAAMAAVARRSLEMVDGAIVGGLLPVSGNPSRGEALGG